jgi:hypothetical protein
MARRIDWDKARRRHLVWSRGADPIWRGDKASIPPHELPARETRRPAKSAPPEDPSQHPLVLSLTIPDQIQPFASFQFTSLHPGHEGLLTKLIERLLREDPSRFLERFQKYLAPDYLFVTSLHVARDGSREWVHEIKPRTNRKTRPGHLQL